MERKGLKEGKAMKWISQSYVFALGVFLIGALTLPPTVAQAGGKKAENQRKYSAQKNQAAARANKANTPNFRRNDAENKATMHRNRPSNIQQNAARRNQPAARTNRANARNLQPNTAGRDNLELLRSRAKARYQRQNGGNQGFGRAPYQTRTLNNKARWNNRLQGSTVRNARPNGTAYRTGAVIDPSSPSLRNNPEKLIVPEKLNGKAANPILDPTQGFLGEKLLQNGSGNLLDDILLDLDDGRLDWDGRGSEPWDPLGGLTDVDMDGSENWDPTGGLGLDDMPKNNGSTPPDFEDRDGWRTDGGSSDEDVIDLSGVNGTFSPEGWEFEAEEDYDFNDSLHEEAGLALQNVMPAYGNTADSGGEHTVWDRVVAWLWVAQCESDPDCDADDSGKGDSGSDDDSSADGAEGDDDTTPNPYDSDPDASSGDGELIESRVPGGGWTDPNPDDDGTASGGGVLVESLVPGGGWTDPAPDDDDDTRSTGGGTLVESRVPGGGWTDPAPEVDDDTTPVGPPQVGGDDF